jgi:hypothetical protein
MDQLRHGCINCIFELADVKYLQRPKPVARVSKKCKRSEVEVVPHKTSGAKR